MTNNLLYMVLFFSATAFAISYLIRHCTFQSDLLKKNQSHTVLFSLLLLLSFLTFNLGIPKHMTGYLNNFWMFYASFDYGDYLETLLSGRHNYTYPPLANILMETIRLMLPKSPEHVAVPGPGGSFLTAPVGSYMILILFITHLLPTALMCHRAIRGSSLTKALFSLAICTSSFVVYAFMRGNVIFFAITFTLYYTVFYDSEDERIRNTALFALAVAANIKVYPAIFGCLLLKDRRWKDIGLCIVYAILLFIPFFFTYDDGFSYSFGRFMRSLTYAGSDKISAPPLQDAVPPAPPPPPASEAEAPVSIDSAPAPDSAAPVPATGIDQPPEAQPVSSGEPQPAEAPQATVSPPVAETQVPPPPPPVETVKKEKGRLLQALTAPTFGIFSLSTAVAAFTKAMHLSRKAYTILKILSYLLYVGISILLFILAKRRWCLLLIPATACYLIPGMTYVYVPIFLLMPLVALLNEEDKRPAEYAAMLIFLIMFSSNWTSWPYVLGYRHFPSLAFTAGLYLTAFLTERGIQKKALV